MLAKLATTLPTFTPAMVMRWGASTEFTISTNLSEALNVARVRPQLWDLFWNKTKITCIKPRKAMYVKLLFARKRIHRRPSPIDTFENLRGHFKSGHTGSLQKRPTEGSRDLDVVLCRPLFGQV